MKKSIIALSILLAGCGSFQLGTSYPAQGQTRAQLEQDILVCKDRASTEANTTGRQVGAFLAGLTIVGAPVAIADDRRKQREVFSACMTERGYRVEPPR
jgi:hypothetical protein